MPSTNITMLQTVANGLGDLKDEMVFVGGSVAELYVSNAAASDIRPTLDVDCVVELSSKTAHAKLEEELRAKKFANDTSQGAPICRWIYKDILVDVMPTDSNVLGFTNIWYEEGVDTKIVKTLPDGTEVFVFPPEYYVAAKFEAHKGRGGNDLRQSHDCPEFPFITAKLYLFNSGVIFYLCATQLTIFKVCNSMCQSYIITSETKCVNCITLFHNCITYFFLSILNFMRKQND